MLGYNLKVVGSNPTPATKNSYISILAARQDLVLAWAFCIWLYAKWQYIVRLS